jgi:hypothetical protein
MKDDNNAAIGQFDGFEYPEQNWSKLPHQLTDELLPDIETVAELKLVIYLLRHTWGYQEFGIFKHITVDEFIYGRKHKNGERMDRGTGLSEMSVRRGLETAIKRGLIEVIVDDRDKGRVEKHYRLAMATSDRYQVDTSEYQVDSQGYQDGTPGYQNEGPEVSKLASRGTKSSPRSEKETRERNLGEETSSERNSEKRVRSILTQLGIAKIKFSKVQYPNRQALVIAAIEEYGYPTVRQAVKDAADEDAKWWSYVANKLEAQRPVVLTGEDYITGPYADYIEH